MTGMDLLAILLLVAVCEALMEGYPAALAVGGVSLAVARAEHVLDQLRGGIARSVPTPLVGGGKDASTRWPG